MSDLLGNGYLHQRAETRPEGGVCSVQRHRETTHPLDGVDQMRILRKELIRVEVCCPQWMGERNPLYEHHCVSCDGSGIQPVPWCELLPAFVGRLHDNK